MDEALNWGQRLVHTILCSFSWNWKTPYSRKRHANTSFLTKATLTLHSVCDDLIPIFLDRQFCLRAVSYYTQTDFPLSKGTETWFVLKNRHLLIANSRQWHFNILLLILCLSVSIDVLMFPLRRLFYFHEHEMWLKANNLIICREAFWQWFLKIYELITFGKTF